MSLNNQRISVESLSNWLSVPLLPISLLPLPGEFVRGYVSRLGRANGFTRAGSMRDVLNLTGFLGPESGDRAWCDVSMATGLSVSLIESMRWSTVRNEAGKKVASFLGEPIARAFLTPRSLRVCPLCLAEKDTLFSLWNLVYATSCPRHGVALADTCCCGRLLRFGSQLDWQCQCGQRLAELPSSPATANALKTARNLEILIGLGGSANNYSALDLPDLFKGLRAQDYLALLHTIGLAATTLPEEDPSADEKHGYRSARRGQVAPISVINGRIEAASIIIGDWPSALYDLLDKIIHRNEAPKDKTPERRAFSTKIGRMFLYPLRGSTGLPLPVLHEAVTSYCATRLNVRRRKRGFTVRMAAARRIMRYASLSSIALNIGVPSNNHRLNRVYSRVISTLSDEDLRRPDDDLGQFVARRAVELYVKAKEAVSLHRARELIDGETGGSHSPECWRDPRLLMPSPELYGLQLPGMELYSYESLQSILDRIDAVAIRVGDTSGLAPLPDCFRGGGLHKGYGRRQFLIDMFDGILPVYTLVKRPNLKALFADPAAFRLLSADRRGCPLDGSETYLRPHVLNQIIERRLGKSARLPAREFTKLAKAGKLRFELKLIQREDRRNCRTSRCFCTQDVLAYLS